MQQSNKLVHDLNQNKQKMYGDMQRSEEGPGGYRNFLIIVHVILLLNKI